MVLGIVTLNTKMTRLGKRCLCITCRMSCIIQMYRHFMNENELDTYHQLYEETQKQD